MTLEARVRTREQPSRAGDVRSATLRDARQIDDAVASLARLGLPEHRWYRQKNWDLHLALEFIRAHVRPDRPILDAGATISPILQHLERLGYRDLHACDLWRSKREALRSFVTRSRVRFSVQDLTATTYADSSFDVVTCISVIEHGVDLEAYCREMARLIRPDGHLITSTDYWCEPIDTSGLTPWNRPWRIFGEAEMREFAALARRSGLVLDGDLDLRCGEPLVRWQERDYTFTYLVLRRA
jgi:SAM-dependent methyltransferase